FHREAARNVLHSLSLHDALPILVESGGLLKVVPEADAKLQAGTVTVGPSAVRGDQVITQIFRLSHENATSLVPVLRPLISPNNTDRKSTRLNSSHVKISYAVFCL